MIPLRFTFSLTLIVSGHLAFAQAGQWKLSGNSLSGTEKLGSTNNAALNFITSNKTRMSLTAAGNLNINSDQSSIQFPVPGANPRPMMFMFPSGSSNTTRMVIAHSPDFPTFGLQYNDIADRFDFVGGGTSVFNVNLISRTVGVFGAFDVSGASTFKGNMNISGGKLGIGTSTPQADLHISRGSSGVSPFFSAPLVIENSSTAYLNILAPNNAETGILFGNPSSNIDGGILYNSFDNSRGMEFRTTGNVTRMTLRNNGFVGLGTVSPAVEMHLLHNDGEDSHHGLRIENIGANRANWTLYSSNGDNTLDLFAKTRLVGFFDDISGEYFSDLQLKSKSKNDAEKAPDVLEKVMQLDIKKLHSAESKVGEDRRYGMMAQDVEKIFPEAVHHKIMNSDKQDVYAVNYSAFGMIALKAIQEQQQKIITLEDRIAKLEAALNNGSISSTGSNNIMGKEISGVSLEQNQPNPFNQTTTIRYRIPQNVAGHINLFDANGTLVKTFKTNESGQAVITGNDLKVGTYTYTLVVNGRIAASRKLIVVK
ncbi:MAG TPA: T9SS type A sorting domain-containing protein [Chitinophagaceae bacterium]|jgi:hypothetical protein